MNKQIQLDLFDIKETRDMPLSLFLQIQKGSARINPTEYQKLATQNPKVWERFAEHFETDSNK